ncbi:HNH endonuclease [Peribacillus sp. NPDC096448]|uniref:HNH endonuclease n=1 Tax=Peribacillus sp. NPDC096448 TaxID=3364395 RepID=UPI00380B2D4A
MIALEKGEKPEILVNKEEQWLSQLTVALSKGSPIPNTIQNRYRHLDIKVGLLKETNNKCAYCESKVLHIDHGDIEHIEPKSLVPSKTFDWFNLTIACRKCNQNKAQYYNTNLPLLNPYTDKTEEEIIFCGPLPFPKPGSSKAKITIKKLQLDRVDLIEKRIELLNQIQPLLDCYENEQDAELKKLLLQDIQSYKEKNKEFSSMVTFFLKQFNLTYDNSQSA